MKFRLENVQIVDKSSERAGREQKINTENKHFIEIKSDVCIENHERINPIFTKMNTYSILREFV